MASEQPHSLRDALRGARPYANDASTDISAGASDSPSEEDYDDVALPSADAMVLRQRKQPAPRPRTTQLKVELHSPDGDDEGQQDTPRQPAHEGEEREGAQGVSSATSSKRLQPVSAIGSPSSLSVPPWNQRDGRRLSATVIFEEKSGAGPLSSNAVTASSSSERAAAAWKEDGEDGLSTATTAANTVVGAAGGGGGSGSGNGNSNTSVGDGGAKDSRSFVISVDDPKLAEILRADLQQMREELEDRRAAGRASSSSLSSLSAAGGAARRRRPQKGRFRDFVFTRKFSAFDRQNEDAANSPFHGFYTLFWLGVFLFVLKIGADNWRKTGSPLGTNEIMNNMFHRDVVVLLLSDGILCGLTGVSWLLQRAVLADYIDWDGVGWVLQNLWQALFVAGFIGWTQLREWPWSHTVFFVLHGLVMLMKQHSYAFYNGYLSTVYKRRALLQAQLCRLKAVAPAVQDDDRRDTNASSTATDAAEAAHAAAAAAAAASPPSPGANGVKPTTTTSPEILDNVLTAVQSGQPLSRDQVRVFERILNWEMDGLAEELRGKASRPDRAYPHNLTFANHYEYIVLPTVVYELEYPRSETINWRYAAEKLVACFGIIFVMIMISQAFIYPVVMQTVAMKEAGVPLRQRFAAFPWMMSDILFPFMMEYMLSWYLIWETILNFLAEITYFADRSFYSTWWNSVTWDEFARDWNRPVHLFLLRHVYHSSISAMKVNKHTATLITFFLSACVHELVMWCIFKKLRGYLLFLQMCQLPLVKLFRSKWLRNHQTLGNLMFWFGIFMGPSALCSLYLIL